MKISLDWLKDYVDIDLPLPALLDKLTMAGLIVEKTEERGGDVVLDVETYSNRPDTLGHLGLAREIAALLGRPLKELTWPQTELSARTTELIDVQILDEELCPRYCGLIVRGLKVGPSPDDLRRRVEAMGLHSINAVVDTTNYVLYATGHPIHAFDLAKLAGPRVLIRRAKKGERMVALDGRDIALSSEMLVIADEKRPVAVAGIIGGLDSAVSDSTVDVFIESAVFDPSTVHRTRKTLEFSTDASYRFERGADLGFAPQAALMAASLLTKFGGKAAKEPIDIYPHPRKPREITLRVRRVADLLGVEIAPEFIEKLLTDLGFVLKTRQSGAWMVQVPSHRFDIEREADLIEEIARFYGYDKIPVVVPPLKVLDPGPSAESKLLRVADRLFHFGFNEVVNQSFADPEREAMLVAGKKAVVIRNPISTRAAGLRTTLLGSLLENAAWNKNRGLDGVHIFEIGRTYRWAGEDETAEDLTLGLATTGPLAPIHWKDAPTETDFYHLKGAVESALESLRYEPLIFALEAHPALEDGQALAVRYKGETIGRLGRVRQAVLDLYELKGPLYSAEIDLDRLFEIKPRPFEFAALPKFPAIVRDLSFWVGREVPFSDIRAAAAKADVATLERFDVIDRYAGPGAPEGKVGLSLRFVYRNPKATLTTEDADKSERKIIKQLRTAVGIQLREGGSL